MPNLPVPVVTIGLLLASNIFMTFAWYGHLKFKSASLVLVILVSWGIALRICLHGARPTASATAISRPPN
jgi:uncharacterized protein (DUF486 family)